MEYVNFGRTGLKVSRICLGCMSYSEPIPGGCDGICGRSTRRRVNRTVGVIFSFSAGYFAY